MDFKVNTYADDANEFQKTSRTSRRFDGNLKPRNPMHDQMKGGHIHVQKTKEQKHEKNCMLRAMDDSDDGSDD